MGSRSSSREVMRRQGAHLKTLMAGRAPIGGSQPIDVIGSPQPSQFGRSTLCIMAVQSVATERAADITGELRKERDTAAIAAPVTSC